MYVIQACYLNIFEKKKLKPKSKANKTQELWPKYQKYQLGIEVAVHILIKNNIFWKTVVAKEFLNDKPYVHNYLSFCGRMNDDLPSFLQDFKSFCTFMYTSHFYHRLGKCISKKRLSPWVFPLSFALELNIANRKSGQGMVWVYSLSFSSLATSVKESIHYLRDR